MYQERFTSWIGCGEPRSTVHEAGKDDGSTCPRVVYTPSLASDGGLLGAADVADAVPLTARFTMPGRVSTPVVMSTCQEVYQSSVAVCAAPSRISGSQIEPVSRNKFPPR